MKINKTKNTLNQGDDDVKKEKDFTSLEKSLNIFFDNKNLLLQAFTHRSYINENIKLKISHNERLEFLGDAILELIATEFLYFKFKDATEGELTTYRAALVNTKIHFWSSKTIRF